MAWAAHFATRAAAALTLVALSPLILLAAAAIRLSCRGPVLFHQERVGLHGHPFRIHKFRTMRAAANGPSITAGRDPRITRVGALLRRFKIDELPQFFNVLKGEMNFVGPRPELPRYVALYPAAQREVVLSVRPGITDLASLIFIDESRLLGEAADPERFYVETLMPAKRRLAETYVRERTGWLDLRILAATATGIVGWRWIPSPFDDDRVEISSTTRGSKRPDVG
jgi:lipopolysaccharide/colanic/teichoic acid biosynthesis glycosyltransferase